MSGTRNGFKYNANKRRLELYVGGTAVEYFNEPPSKTYYVNAATGADTNDGLSWGTAFDQVNAAILASEASRKLQWTMSGSTVAEASQMCRNRIIVQGVNEKYTSILDGTNVYEPNQTDIYGLGAFVWSNGAGQVQIGSATSDVIAMDSTAQRGNNFYNIQFIGGGPTYYCVDVVAMLRCQFLDCSFYVYTSGVGDFRNTGGTFAGNHFDGCYFGSQGGATTYLMSIAGDNASSNLIENCVFAGSGSDTCTNAIKWSGGSHSSIVRNCVFQGVYTVAIADTSTYGLGLWNNTFGSGSSDAYTATQSRNYGGNTQANAHLAV
jgi:hypothetical protein